MCSGPALKYTLVSAAIFVVLVGVQHSRGVYVIYELHGHLPKTMYLVLSRHLQHLTMNCAVELIFQLLVTFVVLVVFKPMPPKLLAESFTTNLTLKAVTVIFQHGASAPDEFLFDGDNWSENFPNGEGALTDLGFRESFKLGQYLRERYVKTGFLRSPLFAPEVYFRSRATGRALQSAALVGSAMWAMNEHDEYKAVPIFSEENDDTLLTHMQNCVAEKRRLRKTCGRVPTHKLEWSDFGGFIHECLGFHHQHPVLSSAKAFSDAIAYAHKDYHDMPVPDWFRSKKKAIYSIIDRVYSFIVGVNDYHDIDLLRVKQGYFLHTITDDLWKQWGDYEKTGKIQKKFRAFVTDNWLMLAFLHALGCGTSALGKSLPRNNPLIMIEMYQGSGKPLVKVFYKDNTMDVPKDVTKHVRGCSFALCHLTELVTGPKIYKTNDIKKACFDIARTKPV